MKFRYKKYGPGVLRPVIPIAVVHKENQLTYEVLVDSGSDVNIFDANLARPLGLNLTSGERAKVSGITGVDEPMYVHPVDLIIGGHLFKDVKVGFLKQIGEYGYGVVGQKGFFDLFKVTFDLKKEEIELKPR
ncbi:MAG: hypothetical protein A2126_00065 [Candidatus Woykebacteria bacterium GWB1_45_5]|uniref:Peptidase A2 domain-containing protein n=2 Tax=Candidatus Woykeibacteriota TaxID=1817899 RepID=A0A1G1W0R0_9BACT|nr:MAG: hypothetical protein A2113_04495 [Candidatus Woykebacteria bacterium GWA1_44_8]OGY22501.1 MAG: hypothetical protein A2126_00065 [Candidatus Woykebacteria bacterium GWB1_45_5]